MPGSGIVFFGTNPLANIGNDLRVTIPRVTVSNPLNGKSIRFVAWACDRLVTGKSLLVQLTQNVLYIPDKNDGILHSPKRSVILHLPAQPCLSE
jgi:hypothetical protein